jgi:hypothetical protein
VIDAAGLNQLDAQQLREVVRSLMSDVASKDAVIAQHGAELERRDAEIAFKQAVIDKINHEMAVLKRLKFAAKSEAFNPEQKSLLEETIDADLAALQAELDKVTPPGRTKARRRRPSARSCRRTCRGARSITSPRTPPAAAARR